MSDIQQVIENLKKVPLETLSNAELDQLKDELIKLLVDIQIQKDINIQTAEKHLSTDDIQLEVMQKADHSEQKSDSPVEKTSAFTETKSATNEPPEQKETNYLRVIQEEISEEVITLYTNVDPSYTNTEKNKKEETHEKKKVDTIPHPSKNITFSINDKFRIQKKLFQNNNTTFEKFIFELNNQTNLDTSVQLIHNYAQQLNWDENSAEYKLLIQYNRKRFQ